PGAETQTLALVLRRQEPGAVQLYAGDDWRELRAHPGAHFQLILPPHSRQLFYLRAIPGSLHAAQIELATIDRMLSALRDTRWFSGLYQGGLTALTLLAVVAALMRRESIYLWLAGYSAMFQLCLLQLNLASSPGLFELAHGWSFILEVPQLTLVAAAFGVRLAQRLPIHDSPAGERSYAGLGLWALLAANIAAVPILLLVTRETAITVTLLLGLLTTVTTTLLALHFFLSNHRRVLIAYVLIRMLSLPLIVGTALAWRASEGTALSGLLPLAALAEIFGMLCLLGRHSLDSDRRLSQEAREITSLAAEARARTEVLAEVGHRIRTPVSGVIGMLDMLLDTPLSAAQLDHLTTIRRAGNELLNIVNEMSDISQLQSSSGALPQTAFNPQALVAECVDGFRSLARAHHLELISDPALALPAYVSGDPTRVRQILLQLLHQTISRRERGEIVIRVQPLPRPHWLQFAIETHASEAMSQLSEIDQRLNPPGSANMRLAIARQLVELLGGRLTLREFPGSQQQVLFELPLPEVSRRRQNPEHDSVLLGKQLLVIDDSPTFCEVLRRQAGHWGMVVHIATSASEGLARLRNQNT